MTPLFSLLAYIPIFPSAPNARKMSINMNRLNSNCLDFITNILSSKGLMSFSLSWISLQGCHISFHAQRLSLDMEQNIWMWMMYFGIIIDNELLISKSWKHLLELLLIFCKISTSHHQVIDYQIKHMNKTLDQHLHCFINYINQ